MMKLLHETARDLLIVKAFWQMLIERILGASAEAGIVQSSARCAYNPEIGRKQPVRVQPV